MSGSASTNVSLGPCPEALHGDPCVYGKGAYAHPLVQSRSALGLPHLVHKTAGGTLWANGRLLPGGAKPSATSWDEKPAAP